MAQAHLELLLQVIGTAAGNGLGRTLAGKAALGGDHQVCRIRIERLGDEFFGDHRTVSVGGVEQGDAQFDGAAQHIAGIFAVGWLTPGAFADEAHGAVAKAADFEVSPDAKGSGQGGVGNWRGGGHHPMRCRVESAVQEPVELLVG